MVASPEEDRLAEVERAKEAEAEAVPVGGEAEAGWVAGGVEADAPNRYTTHTAVEGETGVAGSAVARAEGETEETEEAEEAAEAAETRPCRTANSRPRLWSRTNSQTNSKEALTPSL
jgi:hypothetical protein